MSEAVAHTRAFRMRRFLNWFPLGLAYAMLYMGRYNLTVAKTALGDLMTKEDFGIIFAAGTITYAFSFLLNGPLVDRIGGRKGMLIGLTGAGLANLVMAFYLRSVLGMDDPSAAPLRLVFSVLYAVNMFFQSYGAVSIVKVNAHWFHVDERGGFSGIFGTMISSGIFLAFTVNGWILDFLQHQWPGQPLTWAVFAGPGVLLWIMLAVEFVLLRDKPSLAGLEDFDTGDASSGEDDDTPVPTLQLLKRILTNPIILIVGGVEFCTGVLRNGVMHWFPIYAKEVWALSGSHALRYGEWQWSMAIAFWVIAIVAALVASRMQGKQRGILVVVAGLSFMAPFVNAGWGGLLFFAGVVGGNVAGWVSDLFFQSRRAPAAGGLYAILALATFAMGFVLAPATTTVASAKPESGLKVGDQIVSIAGKDVSGWADVGSAVKCVEATCEKSQWDAKKCMCVSKGGAAPVSPSTGTIAATVIREGKTLQLSLTDPMPKQRAGDQRKLKAAPVLPMSPWLLGGLVLLMSIAVIGTHGLLSGTATMDFGGRRGAATAVGVIDGFVYLGTGLQSLALGYLTTKDWSYWPWFLLPFAILGTLLLTRIWNAKPGKSAH